MDFFEVINRRYSVRKFDSRRVENEKYKKYLKPPGLRLPL